jgi:hypothetical protein
MTDTDRDKAAKLADEVEDFEKPDLTAMRRSELEAEVVHQAKLIERFRQGIANIVLGLEDEGDRVYLGSTNDADELSELDAKLTDCGNELFMPWSHGDDLYADLRELRTENARLREALRQPAPTDLSAAGESLAREFHERYGRLAPQFGYETREETRQFDPESPNGRLMIAVCCEIVAALRARSENHHD